MSIQHIAIFALLGAVYVGWTIYTKRQEAAAERKAEQARQQATDDTSDS